MHVTEHPFSDLLRKPNDVVKNLAHGDVVLRRRGAPALRLTRVDRDEERAVAYAMIGRTLRNLAVGQSDALGQSLLDEFPWTSFLPGDDREQFVREFTRMVVAVAEVDNFAPLSQLVEEWRATAEIHSDPGLASKLQPPVAAKGARVPPPVG
ncbi:MAG: DUF6247 family protein [Candidatus Dormibacteria bacterium]